MESMGQFFAGRAIYEQERDGHSYSPFAFLLASPLILLPFIAASYLCFLLLALLLTGWFVFRVYVYIEGWTAFRFACPPFGTGQIFHLKSKDTA